MDRKSPDAIEGEGNNYERTEISLITMEGQKLTAITCIAKTRLSGIKTSLT